MVSLKNSLKKNALVFKTYKKLLKTRNKMHERLSGVAPIYVSRVKYKKCFKRKLNLENPKCFNEKLMWLKLYRYANDPLVIQCADKYAVRDYVKKCGLENTLNKLIGVWERAEDIDWDVLPERFAIKCNHGCGFNIICRDKKTFDTKSAEKS